MSELLEICCPTCFESFGIVAPGVGELPTELDYDCEICCRPMVICVVVDEASGEIQADVRSLDE